MQQMDPIETHIHTVWSFVRLATLKRVLHEVLPHTGVDFWRIVMGASLDYGLIEWCKIFGNNTDDTHWTNLVPMDRHDVFRADLCVSVGMTDAQWAAYSTEMRTYRNKLAAHFDYNVTVANYPNFAPALDAAFYYYATFLYPEWLGKHPGTRYPADVQAFAADYQKQLLDVATAAAQATKQFEP